jgi:hypothetical protein
MIFVSHRQFQERGPPAAERGLGGLLAQSPQVRPPGSDVGLGYRCRRRLPRICSPIGKNTIHASRVQGGLSLVLSFVVLYQGR